MGTEAPSQQLAPACHEGVNHAEADSWPPVKPSGETQMTFDCSLKREPKPKPLCQASPKTVRENDDYCF